MAAYDRILRVLASFEDERTSRSLSEIAQSVELPRSTTHRLLAHLTEWGALERDEERRYVIGTRMFEIGMRSPRGSRHLDVLKPLMHDLFELTRHGQFLAIPDRGGALVIEGIPGDTSDAGPSVGARLPLTASSTGLVILAFGRREDLGASKPTPRASPEARSMIREVRRKSISIGRAGGADTLAISAPVFEKEGELFGVLSLLAPVTSPDPRELAEGVLRMSRTMSNVLIARNDSPSRAAGDGVRRRAS